MTARHAGAPTGKPRRRQGRSICSIPGCQAEVAGRDRCNTHYAAHRSRQRAYGRWSTLIDAAPTRQHIAALMKAGMQRKLIADLAGVPHEWLYRVAAGGSRRISPENAQRVLAVPAMTPTDPRIPDTSLVSSVGSRRRLRALAAIGWSYGLLAEESGLTLSIITHVISRDDCSTTPPVARAVATTFTKLFDQPGPSEQSRDIAEDKGWALPMEWDDDIDHPDAVPAQARRTGTGMRDQAADRLDIVAEWIADPRPPEFKPSASQLAEQLGVTTRTIERYKKQIRQNAAADPAEDAAA